MNNQITKLLMSQIKREIIEYKWGLIYLPVILIAVMLLTGLGLMIYWVMLLGNPLPGRLGFTDSVSSAMYVCCGLVLAIYAIVAINYLLHSLYDDRKNKTILFFRSMPISELQNVLVKVLVVTVVIPSLLLLINEVTSLLFSLLTLIAFLLEGQAINDIFVGQSIAKIFYIPLLIYRDNLFGMIFLLPIIGYLLCVSAISKKMPLVFAILVPVILIIFDVTLSRMGMPLGIMTALGEYGALLHEVNATFVLEKIFYFHTSLLEPMMTCLVLGGLFLWASIWLRNHYYEI